MKFLKKKEAASVTELGLLAGLISVLIIGTVSLSGNKLNELFDIAGNNINQVVTGSPIRVPVPEEPLPLAKSCQELYDRGETASKVYQVDFTGGDEDDARDVYCDMSSNGGGWMLVLNYASGSYTASGASAYTALDRHTQCSGRDCVTSAKTEQGAGPTLSAYGNLNLLSGQFGSDLYSEFRTDCTYSGVSTYIFPSQGVSLDGSSESKVAVDDGFWWHATVKSTDRFRSNHYSCGRVMTDNNGRSFGFGYCKDGDGSAVNSGSYAAFSLWGSQAFINCVPHSGGEERGSNFKLWVR